MDGNPLGKCSFLDCEINSSNLVWPAPNPFKMAILIASWISYKLYGAYILAKKKPKWLPLWLLALISWMTLSKYLICTRCEKHGEACDFYYLGKWAALLFERQPDKTVDTAGVVAEGGAVLTLHVLPIAASIRFPRMLFKNLLLWVFSELSLLSICCRKCVQYSTDPWKRKLCPSYKLARRMFLRTE